MKRVSIKYVDIHKNHVMHTANMICAIDGIIKVYKLFYTEY